jgi:hypothetical protein
MAKYKEKVGKIVSAVVTRVDKNDSTFIEIGEIKGILQRKNRIKGEYFKVGDTLKAVVKSVNIDKIRTGDTDYEDIINKLYKIVGELSCRETSGNCNSSNGWSDLCNAGIKLFNKLK